MTEFLYATKLTCWDPNPQHDSVWSKESGRVIRVSWGHEGETLWSGLASLLKRHQRVPLFIYKQKTVWAHRKTESTCIPREGALEWSPSFQCFDLDSFRTMKNIHVLFKETSLGYFAWHSNQTMTKKYFNGTILCIREDWWKNLLHSSSKVQFHVLGKTDGKIYFIIAHLSVNHIVYKCILSYTNVIW